MMKKSSMCGFYLIFTMFTCSLRAQPGIQAAEFLENRADRDWVTSRKADIEAVLRNWKSVEFLHQLRQKDPRGSWWFLQSCLQTEVDRELLETWVKMMPESVGVEYELLRNGEGQDLVSRLLSRSGDMRQLVEQLMRPGMREQIPPESWRELVRFIHTSDSPALKYVALFEEVTSVPEAFLDEAELLLASTLKRPRVGNDLQLLGAYLMSYRLQEDAGEKLQTLCVQLMKEGDRRGDWQPFVKDAALDPEGAFWLAAARGSIRSSDRRDDTFEVLAEVAEQMEKEKLRALILSHPANLGAMRFWAQRHPKWIQPIGEALIGELEKEFSLYRMQRVEWCLREHPDFKPPIGRLDKVWRELMESNPRGMTLGFTGANDIGISPRLIWTALLKRKDQITDESESIWHDVPNNLTYILEHGDDALVEEVRIAMANRDQADGIAFLGFEPVLKKVLETWPDIGGDPLQGQLDLHNTNLQNTPWGLCRNFFHGNINQLPVGDFFLKYREGILTALAQGENPGRMIPLLCKLTLEDGLLEEHGDAFRAAIQRCFQWKGATDEQRFCLAYAGFLLGMEDPAFNQAFLQLLSREDFPSYTAYRYYFLLNESHRALLPDLLRALDEADSPRHLLNIALMIGPEDPEVLKRIHAVVFEGQDRELAGEMVCRLRLFDRVPPLEAYPPGRLDWMADAQNKEEFNQLREFLYAYGPREHEELLTLLLPRFTTYASFEPFYGLDILFEESEKNRRAASETLFAMVDSLKNDQIFFACKSLSAYSRFTPAELARLTSILRRFGNELNLNPNLFVAISSMGTEASVLAEEMERLTREGHELNEDTTWGCLANISDDPALRKRSLARLMDMYEESFRKSTVWQPGHVRQIARVQGQKETVIPFLKEVVADYFDPKPDRKVVSRSVQQVMWGWPEQGIDREYFQLLRGMMTRVDGDPDAGDLLQTTLWCLENHYPERLTELREEIEAVPLRYQTTFIYRKVYEQIQ